VHAELAALAALALERTRDRLDANLDGDLELLDAWFELAAASDGQRPIAIDALWAALVPGSAADLADPVEARRAEDWSRLVATLARHARGTLHRLHASHARGVRIVTAEARRLGTLAEPVETIDLVRSALLRLATAASPLGRATLDLIAARHLAAAPEPSAEPDVTRRRHRRFDDLPDRRIVGLILADL
jgi:hypothetical protein